MMAPLPVARSPARGSFEASHVRSAIPPRAAAYRRQGMSRDRSDGNRADPWRFPPGPGRSRVASFPYTGPVSGKTRAEAAATLRHGAFAAVPHAEPARFACTRFALR